MPSIIPEVKAEVDNENVTLHCDIHPDVETSIRCSNCDRPVCPKCMVYTPVGIKCPDCARHRGRSVAGPRPIYYLRAAAAGLIIALAGGLLLGGLGRMIPFGGFLLAIFLGAGIGEAVSRAARRNTGPALQVIAGVAATLAFLIAGYITGAPLFTLTGWYGFGFFRVNIIRLLFALIGIYLAVQKLKD